jgi:hypothetical protein
MVIIEVNELEKVEGGNKCKRLLVLYIVMDMVLHENLNTWVEHNDSCFTHLT